MREVVLDTETTGISVKEGHRIVEIGCIELENLIPTKNKFHCYLNPERKVSEKALEVHGYTDEFLSKQKKFDEIGEDFFWLFLDGLFCKDTLRWVISIIFVRSFFLSHYLRYKRIKFSFLGILTDML